MVEDPGHVQKKVLKIGHRLSSFCESFIKIQLLLAVLEKILCWFELVRLGMVRFGLRQHPSEESVKVSSRSNLFWLF